MLDHVRMLSSLGPRALRPLQLNARQVTLISLLALISYSQTRRSRRATQHRHSSLASMPYGTIASEDGGMHSSAPSEGVPP